MPRKSIADRAVAACLWMWSTTDHKLHGWHYLYLQQNLRANCSHCTAGRHWNQLPRDGSE